MLEVTIDRRPLSSGPPMFGRRIHQPLVLAIFAFRYDAHLVPDLIENIRPMVDGWVSLDDRNSAAPFSSDRQRRLPLIEAAMQHNAGWILAIDPDERFEPALAAKMSSLTSTRDPVAWSFRLRELYAPTRYRIDGPWGRKVQARLFNVSVLGGFDPGAFQIGDLHAQWHPRGHRIRRSGLDLYHLKMIDPARRATRRDLYKALDPDSRFQVIGYDYLAEDEGARFAEIPPRRMYHPPHRDDGGTWMASPDAITGTPSRQNS